MNATDGHQGDGAAGAPSAFDRLFHRLVVAGGRPVVRKKKKKTSTKKPLGPPPPATAPLPPIEPLTPDGTADQTASKPVAEPASPSVDALAVACVRRLRLYRSLRRRLSRLPRGSAIQAIAENALLKVLKPTRRCQNEKRRRRLSALPLLSANDRARGYMRLEGIAARLYDRCTHVRDEAAASACGSSASRVIPDFRFPLAHVTFQSRAHYENGQEETAAKANIVPMAPQISW